MNTINGDVVNLSTILSLYGNDIGIHSMNYPIGEEKYKTGSYSVNISAGNFGYNMSAGCNITCSIFQEIGGTWELNWTETTNISNVEPGEKKHLEFSLWNVSEEGNYAINISSDLLNDEYSSNDYLNSTILITNTNDSGVVSINYPSGKLSIDVYNISTTIKNYGTWDLTNVTVNCSIYRGEGINQNLTYSSDIVISSFSAREEQNLIFSNWNITQVGWYTINVSTELDAISDYNESNDFKTNSCVIG